jgi:hypothetical protein
VLIIDVNSVLGLLQRVVLGDSADVTEVYPVSIFRINHEDVIAQITFYNHTTLRLVLYTDVNKAWKKYG